MDLKYLLRFSSVRGNTLDSGHLDVNNSSPAPKKDTVE